MSLTQQLIQWRRELHKHPECSGKEYETSARIKLWLKDAGINIVDYPIDTGVIAEIGQGDKLIALRADIDALPIEEATQLPFSSVNLGVMHACGHDIHTSVMLGAALLLKSEEASLEGRVRFIFQPSEESFEGAKTLIKAGVLEDVRAIFGMHNERSLPVGTFATRSGPFYATVDRFIIDIEGKGAHAARPHEGIDPIVISSQLINHIQLITSRQLDALETAVVSVTRIAGGNTWNVIPEHVQLEGTIRTHNQKVRSKIHLELDNLSKGLSLAFGAHIRIQIFEGPNTLVNDVHWTNFSSLIAKNVGYTVQDAPLHMGGEDFAAYLECIPGAFVSIGSESQFGLHHPAFNPNEDSIKEAAYYFKSLAKAALEIA